jgi:hypothetical protein
MTSAIDSHLLAAINAAGDLKVVMARLLKLANERRVLPKVPKRKPPRATNYNLYPPRFQW